MNARYSISQYVVATLVAAAVLVLPVACEDDLGYRNVGGQPVAFKLTAPDAWHGGMSVDESAPTTHCTSVQALSGGGTQLYLHTVVADNPAIEKVAVSRGTPIKGKEDGTTAVEVFKTTYPRFSLSGICYTDDSFDAETQKDWTANFAYNQYYSSATGTPADGGKHLLWPSHGNVCFFAFAPTMDDFKVKSEDDGSLTLSTADYKGSPTLTYTVPTDVNKQVDLMTANTASATTAPTAPGTVNLEFSHALTAVQIKCGKDMLVGTIKEVTIAGIYGKGTHIIGSKKWELDKDFPKATYTILRDIELSAGENADQTHVPEGTPIAGTDTDNLTFMLLPQTLPADATMTIKFTDKATKTERTLSAKIAGHVWKPGTIVTYSVSASSIHISDAKVKFSKPDGAVIPYSGVWYDAKCTAYSEVTQEGAATVKIDIPEKSVKLQYSFDKDDENSWKDCTKDSDGLLVIEAQPAYTEINSNVWLSKNLSVENNSTADAPFSLSDEYGETANCYLVDKAGYYSLPLVYGNCGNGESVPEGHKNGLKYFPKYDDREMPNSGNITDDVPCSDAVLLWQDAPDLIDSSSVKIKDGNLVFRIRKQTLAQGNAVVAVRDNSTPKKILWSWHIWVTPYKSEFYQESTFYHSETVLKPEGYYFAKYNLGWCDKHGHNPSRKFSLRAVVNMSAYGGGETTVNIGTFTQDIFKGSDGGDNTYYQWGRKDPMLGGIYNDDTPKYQYTKKKGYKGDEKTDTEEFTMENKQVFNQYNKDGYNYSFCKNPGDKIDLSDPASNGVTIGYTIQHPYMFVTNSRCNDKSNETSPFNYRNHWHVPYMNNPVPYLNKGTHIMFNAWDAGATAVSPNETDPLTARDIVKSVYDPCPPRFKVPPLDAFRGIVNNKADGSGKDNAWKLDHNGSIEFPMTGVRNYALRNNEWGTVVPLGSTSDPDANFCREFYKTSMPAFRMLTFVSTATIIPIEATVGEGIDPYNAYQVVLFRIDHSDRNILNYNTVVVQKSSNSYGLAVRPIRDK